MFDVSKHGEVISRNLAVARIGGDHVDFAFGDSPVHEFRLHLPLRCETSDHRRYAAHAHSGRAKIS